MECVDLRSARMGAEANAACLSRAMQRTAWAGDGPSTPQTPAWIETLLNCKRYDVNVPPRALSQGCTRLHWCPLAAPSAPRAHCRGAGVSRGGRAARGGKRSEP